MKYAMGSSVGERGQITIEKEIRDRLGIKPKDIAIQHIVDGRLVVTFVPHVEPHMRSLAGILGPPPRKPRRKLDIDRIVGEAIAEEHEDYLRREGLVVKPRRRRPSRGTGRK